MELLVLASFQCPDCSLEKILQWAHIANSNNSVFPLRKPWQAYIQWMYKLLHHSCQHLQTGGIRGFCVALTRSCLFWFQHCIVITCSAGWDIDANWQFGINSSCTLVLVSACVHCPDAHTGQRCCEPYAELIVTPTISCCLAPIILYLDGTASDDQGCLEVCPGSFT